MVFASQGLENATADVFCANVAAIPVDAARDAWVAYVIAAGWTACGYRRLLRGERPNAEADITITA